MKASGIIYNSNQSFDDNVRDWRKGKGIGQMPGISSDDNLKIDILRGQLANFYHQPEERETHQSEFGGSDEMDVLREEEKNTSLTPVESLSYRTLRIIGAGILGFSLIYLLFIFEPIISDGVSHNLKREEVKATSLVGGVVDARDNKVQEEAQSYGVDSAFSIVVPKINAVSNIIPNVDVTNEGEYSKALEEGVAHASGTHFPGQGKNIYLFSHSTNSPLLVARYNAVFYKLADLSVNDQIIIFYSNKKYVYEVTDKTIVDAKDTSYLTKDFAGETVILQTCYPAGTTAKRLLIVAKPVDK